MKGIGKDIEGEERKREEKEGEGMKEMKRKGRG